MFGEIKATTTTFWGETSLVCLLPPSIHAGTVPVTFKHQHQQQQGQGYPTPPIKQTAYFKYVDDDEQQIIRTALSVLGHKMTGRMEDVRELARRIVGEGPQSWSGASIGQSPTSGASQPGSNFNAATFGVDVEATLMRILELIDLDDSPHTARLNMRRASGQTMLHLACSLGLHRFAAGLVARGANTEPRDKGGFTPMHFASLHNHPQIIKRLMLNGADPTMRSLQGYTPSDMATSDEVRRACRRIEHHSRTRSGSSLRSRTSSATSLRSLWEAPTALTSAVDNLALSDDSDASDDDEDEDDDAAQDGHVWMRSRKSSAQIKHEDLPQERDSDLIPSINVVGPPTPNAAMTAFKEQITAHIHHFQETMHASFPNLPQMPRFDMSQMPRFDMSQMPALPDYQHYLPTAPMVRRISNLVRPDSANANPKEQDYKWWDLFSGTVPAAPPAYEDIFPQSEIDAKHASALQAAADTVADNKCSELFEQTETIAESSRTAMKRQSPIKLDTVRIGQRHTITREQQDQLRLAHAEKLKRLSRDRNLFFIWVCAMSST